MTIALYIGSGSWVWYLSRNEEVSGLDVGKGGGSPLGPEGGTSGPPVEEEKKRREE